MNNYIPDMYQKDIFTIDYKYLKKKGIKCLLIDLDNTLAKARENEPNEKVIALIDELKKDFNIILFSNSFVKRVAKFGHTLTIDNYGFVMKPFSKHYMAIAKKHRYFKKDVACIGDQLRTDIKGANKAGFMSILVDPIDETKDVAFTSINRGIEKIIYNALAKKGLFTRYKYYQKRGE